MAEHETGDKRSERPATRHRLWPWFVVGCVLTFLISAMSLTMYSMLPSGEGIIAIKLWKYYANEWPRAFGATTLGPASANQGALISTTLQHLGLSVLGGLALLVVGWLLRRRALMSK